MTRIWWLLVVVACSKAESPPAPVDKGPDPGLAPKAPEIKVVLAGVSLGDDCAEGSPTRPPAPPASAGSAAAAAAEMSSMRAPSAGSCPQGVECGRPPPPACEQTAMQLSLQAPDGTAATKLKVKQVELLDDAGKSLGMLTARAPSKWDGKGTYVPWDEAIAGGKSDVAISYKLSSPDWSKVSGGRWGAAGKKFALRVTFAISDKDRTIEKQALVVVMPEAAVST